MVAILIPEKDFGALVEALIEKYGKPSSDTNEHAQNRMGATFENRTVKWLRGALPSLPILVQLRDIDLAPVRLIGRRDHQQVADDGGHRNVRPAHGPSREWTN